MPEVIIIILKFSLVVFIGAMVDIAMRYSGID